MSGSDILAAIAALLAEANYDSGLSRKEWTRAPVVQARQVLCAALGIDGDNEDPAEIRAKLSVSLELTGQDWPPDLSDPLVRRGRELAAEDNDPEMLSPVDRLYYASWLIRDGHRVIDDDWLLWGNLADHLEWAAGIPRRTGATQDWRAFNRAADLATGIIRLQDHHEPTRAKLLRWVNEIGSTV
jgi:hypothetical protein